MSNEAEEAFDHVANALPKVGDQVVATLSIALGEPVFIVLHVIKPSDGRVMMTTNMPEEILTEFMDDTLREFGDGNYTIDEGVTIQ